MAKKIIFPFSKKDTYFDEVTCLESSIVQGVALSSLDIKKANRILDISSRIFEIPSYTIIEYGRKREACLGRSLFASTLLKQTRLPLACIGGFLSGRDHTTVMHMSKIHHEYISSRDTSFDRYKSASLAMDSYLEKVATESFWSESFQVITEKNRFDDLVKFSQVLLGVEVSEQSIRNYMTTNSL